MTLDVIGIGAWDRSGSTILAEVLGTAPDVISVGEINNLWTRGLRQDRMCSCGEAFSNCAFWSKVLSAAFDGPGGRAEAERIADLGARLSNQRMLWHHLRRRPDPLAEEYAAGLGKLYRAVAEVSGRSVIVDSSKIPWHLHAAGLLSDVRLWLIHLVRDPRGVVLSHQKAVPYDDDDADPEMMARHGAVFTTLGWIYRSLVLSGLWGKGERYLRVGYEDFVGAPERTVAGILASVGLLEPPEFDGPGRIRLETGHSVSGNPVRFASGATTIELDDAWRRGLSPGERWAVGTATWPFRMLYRKSTELPLEVAR